uniref:Uncharacterized protein n=1 Tax=Strigamia maritima TaxID=126957 RepID=T1JPD2_STRMM
MQLESHVLPILFVGTWAWVMAQNHHKHCWKKYGELYYTWILAAPITVALTVKKESLTSAGSQQNSGKIARK